MRLQRRLRILHFRARSDPPAFLGHRSAMGRARHRIQLTRAGEPWLAHFVWRRATRFTSPARTDRQVSRVGPSPSPAPCWHFTRYAGRLSLLDQRARSATKSVMIFVQYQHWILRRSRSSRLVWQAGRRLIHMACGFNLSFGFCIDTPLGTHERTRRALFLGRAPDSGAACQRASLLCMHAELRGQASRSLHRLVCADHLRLSGHSRMRRRSSWPCAPNRSEDAS
jgi:hypothetical protein